MHTLNYAALLIWQTREGWPDIVKNVRFLFAFAFAGYLARSVVSVLAQNVSLPTKESTVSSGRDRETMADGSIRSASPTGHMIAHHIKRGRFADFLRLNGLGSLSRDRMTCRSSCRSSRHGFLAFLLVSATQCVTHVDKYIAREP